uniref:Fungal lipase-type domain-containing protein n=1 Tax=Araucaria cunninghamii TaxID=56994 RepID=A0A0D6QWV1_ARACU
MEHGWRSQNLKYAILLFVLYMSALCAARELRTKIHDQNLVKHVYEHAYNRTLAMTLVQYASAVYMDDLSSLLSWTCSRCNGLTEGFEVIELVVDIQHCLQAFVGIAEDLNSIVIAFRGTQENSLQNWVEDLFCKKLDLSYPDMPGAMVHHGFYSAYHNTSLRPRIVEAVQVAQQKRDGFTIMVTGHSMGGAMAAFCALDLAVNFGVDDIEVMTFGQPRVGNSIFASYYSTLVPKTIRVTHEHDIVPHLPPYYTHFPRWTYFHFPREVWLYDVGFGSLTYEAEKICDNSGEDPSCSRSVSGNSVADHLQYYGVSLQSETWGSCGIPWQQAQMNKADDALDNIIPSVELRAPRVLPKGLIDSSQHSSM